MNAISRVIPHTAERERASAHCGLGADVIASFHLLALSGRQTRRDGDVRLPSEEFKDTARQTVSEPSAMPAVRWARVFTITACRSAYGDRLQVAEDRLNNRPRVAQPSFRGPLVNALFLQSHLLLFAGQRPGPAAELSNYGPIGLTGEGDVGESTAPVCRLLGRVRH